MKNGQTTPSATVEKISMNLIDPFPNHPFYIFDDNEMIELIESIRKNGLITPIKEVTAYQKTEKVQADQVHGQRLLLRQGRC